MKILLTLILLLFSVFTMACPFCDSDTADDIRALILGPDLLLNVFTVILPFIVFGILTIIVYKSGKPSNM